MAAHVPRVARAELRHLEGEASRARVGGRLLVHQPAGPYGSAGLSHNVRPQGGSEPARRRLPRQILLGVELTRRIRPRLRHFRA